jgi:TIP49 AAA-lid domain
MAVGFSSAQPAGLCCPAPHRRYGDVAIVVPQAHHPLLSLWPSQSRHHACPAAQVEGIEIDEDSLARLGEIGERASLRHAVQLLTPCAVLARTNGRDAISRGDLDEADGLFHDAKYSARLLHEQADKYIT